MFDRKTKQIQELKQKQIEIMGQDKDDYTVGMYNGIELCLALLERREPDLLFIMTEQTNEKEEMKERRRTVSGVCRRR